jgi:hypothetical protein
LGEEDGWSRREGSLRIAAVWTSQSGVSGPFDRAAERPFKGNLCAYKGDLASLRSHDLSEQRAGLADIPRCLAAFDLGEHRLQQRVRIVGRPCLAP